MRPRVRATALLVAAVLTGGGLAACSSGPGPASAISDFMTGWRTGQFAGSLHLIGPSGDALTGQAVATQIKTLSGDLAAAKPTLKAGTATVDKDDARVPIDVAWPVESGVTWSYQTTLRLRRNDGKWDPIFEPSVVAAQLTEGDKLTVKTAAATRGSILDGGGQPLVTAQPVVNVGVQPSLITDQTSLINSLNAAFRSANVDVDLADLPNQIKDAQPTAFVPVVTLRQTVYNQIRSQIHDLNGTVFTTSTLDLGPTSTFARALLGSVGDVTKERMDKSPGKYQIGDQVGFGGLEEAYDDQLRGKSGVSVIAVPAKSSNDSGDDSSGDSTGDQDGKTLFTSDPVAGKSIKTTLDQRTEKAAETALTMTQQPSALVAIRISDGSILAVANGPGAQGQDLALDAQVPPGSMFKTVTATNLLEAGKIDVNTAVNCPQTLTVDGYTIHNSEFEQLGTVPLHVDFAKSCNTAFASLAPKLGPTGLADTAKRLGVGIPWDLGIDAYTGSVSANGDAAEQAAAAFGQGKTTVSPVIMAAMAAAVQRGQWKQPHLILDPAPAHPAPDQAPLKSSTVSALKQMMREVVTDGTAVKDKNVPGDPIYGKTGTAEHDNKPSPTHSWFMGYRGDIAFAVFVEDGGMSTDAAVPIAGKFFTALG
ncbi:penicillin-binding transpeptidase domain-containing protein [Rugosimonospora acidiphila]|uniref:Penicillin-binding transpeptidase domain-containing protein n=1 Tax=Rugosimonospora acidiphila TaxID=556531 RepID=A0ABP9RPN8_9ACTN